MKMFSPIGVLLFAVTLTYLNLTKGPEPPPQSVADTTNFVVAVLDKCLNHGAQFGYYSSYSDTSVWQMLHEECQFTVTEFLNQCEKLPSENRNTCSLALLDEAKIRLRRYGK